MMPTKALGAGEVGYVITGAKDVSQSKVGDTITSALNPATEPLEGYRDPQPMVYAGLFPIDNAQYPELREALDKLKLNDAALIYEPETSVALGFGFRCGFLGLLHMEIVTERLSREFDLDLISTAPNVPYESPRKTIPCIASPIRANSPKARSRRSSNRWLPPTSSRRRISSVR